MARRRRGQGLGRVRLDRRVAREGRRSPAVGLRVGRAQHARAGALHAARQYERPARGRRAWSRSSASTRSRIRTTAAPGSARTFPSLFYIVSPGGYGAATWTAHQPRSSTGSTTPRSATRWLAEHIQQGHGPLGAAYPDVAYGMEGDTPAWLRARPEWPERPRASRLGRVGRALRAVSSRTSRSSTPKGFTGGVPDRARDRDRSGRTPSTTYTPPLARATTGAHSRTGRHAVHGLSG